MLQAGRLAGVIQESKLAVKEVEAEAVFEESKAVVLDLWVATPWC